MSGTPDVSVLTPVHRPVAEWLLELHASLGAQHGIAWEWIVQVDGDAALIERLPAAIRADARVATEANGRWLGQSVTRNLALLRCRAPLLQTVDADDLLEPGALALTAGRLREEPGAAFAFGRTRDLQADGTLTEGKNLYPPGRLEPGVLADDWEARGGSCSIVVPSVMWRTAVVDACAGWPASVAGMDVLLLLAVAAEHPGLVLAEPTYRYRCHPEQIHRGALRQEMRPKYRALARRMLAARRQRAGVPD
jgi:glycosyltransferase involved in cell wall biosynthesis